MNLLKWPKRVAHHEPANGVAETRGCQWSDVAWLRIRTSVRIELAALVAWLHVELCEVAHGGELDEVGRLDPVD